MYGWDDRDCYDDRNDFMYRPRRRGIFGALGLFSLFSIFGRRRGGLFGSFFGGPRDFHRFDHHRHGMGPEGFHDFGGPGGFGGPHGGGPGRR